MILFNELAPEEVEEWAIRFIGAIDYDIEKECKCNLEEFNEDSLVDDVVNQMESFMRFLSEKSNAT